MLFSSRPFLFDSDRSCWSRIEVTGGGPSVENCCAQALSWLSASDVEVQLERNEPPAISVLSPSPADERDLLDEERKGAAWFDAEDSDEEEEEGADGLEDRAFEISFPNECAAGFEGDIELRRSPEADDLTLSAMEGPGSDSGSRSGFLLWLFVSGRLSGLLPLRSFFSAIVCFTCLAERFLCRVGDGEML